MYSNMPDLCLDCDNTAELQAVVAGVQDVYQLQEHNTITTVQSGLYILGGGAHKAPL